MATTSDLEKGQTIKRDSKLWFVMSLFFVSPGKGNAFYKVKLKEVQTGKVIELTLKSGETMEIVDTMRRHVQFLYREGDSFVFMDEENYEQHTFSKEIVSDELEKFLIPEERLILFLAEENAINISFARTKIPFQVIESPPFVKGDTVNKSYKAIKIETGATIQAPAFIKEGERILVNVDTSEYVERYKE